MDDALPDGRYVFNRRGYGAHQAVTEFCRPGTRVLDVGCSVGHLMEHLQQQLGCRTTGIDTDAAAVATARGRGLDVQHRAFDAAAVDDLSASGPFDHVVLADVLEHMADPAPVLALASRLLAPDGSVVVSLPNIAYAGARLSVALGRFEYEDTGIFDRTHLRFFTVASGRRLVEEAGFRIVRTHYVGPLTHRIGRRALRLNDLRPGLLSRQMVLEAVRAG